MNSQQVSQRLALLRQAMQGQGISGFLIPRADEYASEYIAPYAERLRYISGFSGSAGVLLVCIDKAYLFIDGRYTIQAKQEVAGTPIECRALSWSNICAAVTDKNNGIEVLGLDLHLLSQQQFSMLEKACEDESVEVRGLDTNPVDSFWYDQPPRPCAEVAVHGLEYAGVASMDKRRLLAERLVDMQAEASLIAAADSIAWLLNVRGNDVAYNPVVLSFGILLNDSRFLWFVEEKKLSQEVRDCLDNVDIYPPRSLFSVLSELRIASIYLDAASVNAACFAECRRLGLKIKHGSDLCLLPKARKNATETSNTRLAHLWDGVAVCEFLHWFSQMAVGESLTEMSAAEKLQAIRSRNERYRQPSFDTISATAGNGAICHYRVDDVSNRLIRKGDIYLFDSGGQYFEGTTDITRTVLVGDRVDDEVKDRFTRVLKGHIAIATARFPEGISGDQLDALARASLWSKGLDYLHGTGHGVGSYLNVHEGPQRITSGGGREPLQEGMIVSNEPGYYAEGRYGIRIENLVLVCDSGEVGDNAKRIYYFETLSLSPIDKRLIVEGLLNSQEKAWLNAYHARVSELLSPHLSEAARQWLAEATTAL